MLHPIGDQQDPPITYPFLIRLLDRISREPVPDRAIGGVGVQESGEWHGGAVLIDQESREGG